MKKFRFIAIFITLLLILSTVTVFAGYKSSLYASWKCTESYDTSDVVGDIDDIYSQDLSSVLASCDGYSTRESDFELHAGDVVEISGYAEPNDTIREGDSADHFISLYCGDYYISELNMPLYSDDDYKEDFIKVTIPKEAISNTGKNNLILKYQINNSYYTSAYIDSIYINGQFLECR